MAMKRLYAKIEGRVQGVFFRACTRDEALNLALSGWVRNCADGSVETEFQGEERELTRMVNWLHCGSPASAVSKVSTTECPLVLDEDVFRISY